MVETTIIVIIRTCLAAFTQQIIVIKIKCYYDKLLF